MDRNDEEILLDIVLGEAVMALLKDDAAIGNAALIKQLQRLSETETDSTRKRVYRLAIAEVRNYASARAAVTRHKVGDRDNKRHLYNHQGPADGAKKH